MKNSMKSICLCLLLCACASLPSSKQNKSFIILNTNDTVFGEKIRFARSFGEIGQVKLKQANGTKQFFSYDEIYQIQYHRKNQDFYVEEMVALTPNSPTSLTLMDIVVNTGMVKLYQHDPTGWGNTNFIVSDGFYGYVRTQKEWNLFIAELKKCVAFAEKYNDENDLKDKILQELVEFYNENCGKK